MVRGALLLAVAAAAAPAAGLAQVSPDWTATKCRLYSAAWARVIDERGTQGLDEDFLLAHQRFLDAGCEGPRDVCPRTPQELALADLLSVVAINEGMTGSFLPFGCPR